jgi:hypothetical protein
MHKKYKKVRKTLQYVGKIIEVAVFQTFIIELKYVGFISFHFGTRSGI